MINGRSWLLVFFKLLAVSSFLVLRRVLNPLSPVEAMELLIDKLGKTRANQEFLGNMSSL